MTSTVKDYNTSLPLNIKAGKGACCNAQGKHNKYILNIQPLTLSAYEIATFSVGVLRQGWDMPSPQGALEHPGVSKTTSCPSSTCLRCWIRVRPTENVRVAERR